jgi:hypothetical protein
MRPIVIFGEWSGNRSAFGLPDDSANVGQFPPGSAGWSIRSVSVPGNPETVADGFSSRNRRDPMSTVVS